MKHRIFVAIHCPPELQEKAGRWQAGHRLPVRWIAGKNLHITLVPPWYEEDLEKVKRDLSRLQKHRRFTITFNCINFGPSKRPRLIWATGETTKEILELQEHVESCLGAHDDGQFKLHMTLARFRPEFFQTFPLRKLDERITWSMPVESIVLMESRLSKEGADYEVLEEIRFRE